MRVLLVFLKEIDSWMDLKNERAYFREDVYFHGGSLLSHLLRNICFWYMPRFKTSTAKNSNRCMDPLWKFLAKFLLEVVSPAQVSHSSMWLLVPPRELCVSTFGTIAWDCECSKVDWADEKLHSWSSPAFWSIRLCFPTPWVTADGVSVALLGHVKTSRPGRGALRIHSGLEHYVAVCLWESQYTSLRFSSLALKMGGWLGMQWCWEFLPGASRGVVHGVGAQWHWGYTEWQRMP